MNPATEYLGLTLRNPLVIGASPCCDDLKLCCALEEAGAAALVMHSLFEEQVELEENARHRLLDGIAESHAEAADYFPRYDDYALTPDLCVRQLVRLKSALSIPIIASLNGRRAGGWIDQAQRLESAGADAIELNLYGLPSDPDVDGATLEADQLFIVREVVASVRIPVTVKLSPFYSSLSNFVRQIQLSGASGVVLFNRFLPT